MSDPMTNIQIEDVLSSIRKLVAEGDKTRQPEVSLTQAHTQTADKLILTDALRIHGKPAADLRHSPQEQHVPTPPAAAVEEVVTRPVAPTLVLQDAAHGVIEITFEDEDENDSTDQTTPEPQTAGPPQDGPTEFRRFDREALSQGETPLHKMQHQDAAPEPADAYEDDLIADTVEDLKIDERLSAYLSDESILADAVFDQDALRQMIVEIIREELQGTLGERITRNVRKMVRREISRTLAAQNID